MPEANNIIPGARKLSDIPNNKKTALIDKSIFFTK